MNCPNCGGEIAPESAFCRHCGAPLPEQSAAGAFTKPEQPAFPPEAPSGPGDVPPPAGPAPPAQRSGGNRTLLIVLIAVVVVLLLGAVAIGALLVPFSSRSDSDVTPVVTATVGPDSTTPGSEPGSTTPDSGADGGPQVDVPPYASSDWVELTLPDLPEEAYYAFTSDVAAVFETQATFYAYIYSTGELVHIPTELNTASWVSIDGDRMVWWEAQYDENNELVEEGVFSYRLPDGPRVELLTGAASVAFPLISEGYVTWLDGRESADNPEEYWELPIYGAALDADGALESEPELLVENPRSYMLGDSTWTYDLSPEYLAWEDHEPADGGDAGTWVLDRRSGVKTFIGPITWRPSLSGTSLSFSGEDGLRVRDLTTGEERVVDQEGDWATLTPEFVAYLRSDYEGDATAWNLVTVGLDGQNERVIGTQTSPPWFGPTLSASPGHVAFVGEGGEPHVFELRTR